MSADQPAPEFVDDGERVDRPDLPEPVPADAPIREIAPDDFVARSSEQTFLAAWRKLERETTREPDALPRCPECHSINIRTKRAPERGTDTAYRCAADGCWAHFDEPAPPREREAPGEQATLPGVRER